MIGAGGDGVVPSRQRGRRHGTSLLSKQPTPQVRPKVPDFVNGFRKMGRKGSKTKDTGDTSSSSAAAAAAAAAAAVDVGTMAAAAVGSDDAVFHEMAAAAEVLLEATAEAETEAALPAGMETDASFLVAAATMGGEQLNELWVEGGALDGNRAPLPSRPRSRSGRGRRDPALEQLRAGTFVKGLWTPQEDEMLLKAVERFGLRDWVSVEKAMRGRRGKQCRERYHNHLVPEIVKTPWTPEEDRIITDAVQQSGTKWTLISSMLPQKRAPNAIKNRWNATLKRRVAATTPALERQPPPARTPRSRRPLKEAAERAAKSTDSVTVFIPHDQMDKPIGAAVAAAAAAAAAGSASAGPAPGAGAAAAHGSNANDDGQPQFLLLCRNGTETPVCTYPVPRSQLGLPQATGAPGDAPQPQIVYGFPGGPAWPFLEPVTLAPSLAQPAPTRSRSKGKDNGRNSGCQEAHQPQPPPQPPQQGRLFVSTNAQGGETHRVVSLSSPAATALPATPATPALSPLSNPSGEGAGRGRSPLFPAAAEAIAKAASGEAAPAVPAAAAPAAAAVDEEAGAHDERDMGNLSDMVIVQRVEDRPAQVDLPHTRNTRSNGNRSQFPAAPAPAPAPSSAEKNDS